MLTTRHVIRVEPSRRQQWVLIVSHLLLGALLWDALQGGYASSFGLLLSLSLGYSLYRARRCRFEVTLQGAHVEWQAARYTLGPGSRIGAGFLWLDLDGPHPCRLWIFVDSVAAVDYRRLARYINLLRNS